MTSPNTKFSPSGLLSREQAAAYLCVQPQTLATWACSGRYALPYVRIGRRAMYRPEDLDAFIAANTILDGVAR